MAQTATIVAPAAGIVVFEVEEVSNDGLTFIQSGLMGLAACLAI